MLLKTECLSPQLNVVLETILKILQISISVPSDHAKVIIEVTDTNDNWPEFPSNILVVGVARDAPYSDPIGQLKVCGSWRG